jgi:DNA-binding response OmpR family regulator
MCPFPSSLGISDPAPTLLVVDHDPVFREFEARTLGVQGYQVLKATGVAEAMSLARSTAAIHLLLTDLSTPQFDGLELTKRFRALRPETPVLLFTGDSPWLDHRTEKLERFAVMDKPFVIKELLHRIRALLDAAVPFPR